MTKNRNLRSLLAATLSLLVACSRASAPVPTKVGGVLTVGKDSGSKPEQFGVVFAGPTGEVAPESEIQIVFSRPVRPLNTLANAEIPRIEIRPAVAGTWRWIGTQALVFAPTQQRLPRATVIDVTVPGDVRALDGSVLGAPYAFQFRTPAPKLVQATSSDDREHLRENSQFELTFDQPIALEELRGRVRLESEAGGRRDAIPCHVESLADKKPKQGFRVVPRKALPRAAQIQIVVGKGLPGLEGTLATSGDQVESFSTVSPLVLEKVDCDRATPKQACDARSGIDLVFNNPVSIRELKKHLSVDGAPGKIASWYSDEEFASYVHLNGPFRVGASSNLRISAGLRDEFRQPLAAAYVDRIQFDDYFPSMALGISGEVFETTTPSAIPVGMVNVKEYERLFVPLSTQGLAVMLSAADGAELFARGQRQPDAIYEQRVAKFPQNQMGVDSFEPNARREPWLGAGLLAVRFSGVPRQGDTGITSDARLIQRTNLGITGQIGRHGSAVWVSELDTGKPVPNAEVFVLHADASVRETVRTDSQGVARLSVAAIASSAFDEPDKHPAAVVAKLDRQLAYRRLSDLIPEWRIPVPVDRSGQLATRVMLFSERGMYRPGERIDVKAVLRDEQPRGLALPKQRQVRIELLSPDNQKVAAKSATLSEFGTTAAQFALPLAASTGQWSLRLSQGKEDALATTSLTVAEYRPVELEVSVVPAQSELLRGGQLSVAVSAKSLFGMASAGATARLEAYRERTTFVPPGAADYVTDADVYDEGRRDVGLPRAQLLLRQATLDAKGRTDATVAAELPGALGPEWIHFEAEVSDASQNPVAASARSLVHPAEYYVALKRLKNSWVTAPGRFNVEVAAFAPDGSRKLDRRIELELLRRTWSVVRRDDHGVVRSSNEPSDQVTGRCEVTSAAVDRTCSFELKTVGSYFVLARSRDEKNRTVRAAQSIYAVGAGQSDFADTDERRVELLPDKTEYNVGDVARVLVKTSITDAEALITTGRSEVHSIERRVLNGSAPVIEIPIRDDMRPNLFVMLNLVTGRKRPPPARADAPDLGAPTYRMGWTELKIGSADRRLAVALTPSTRSAAPGAEVDFAVSVRDTKGNPTRGEVTLWAVDEGVLALGDYQVPDPFTIFLGSRPLQLLPLESRDALGRRTLSTLREELGMIKGSSGAGGGESSSSRDVRQDFRATAFFKPNLMTNAQGVATARFRLPDGLTTYRVFALALSGTEQYGFVTDRIVASKPLMVRPTLPRFFRDGDQAQIGVTLASASAPDGTAAIGVQTQGMSPQQQSQNVRLTRGESTELLFPVTVTDRGSSAVTISAQLGAYRDQVKLARPVRDAIAWQVVGQSGETQGRAIERLGDLSQVRADRGYLELTLSNGFLAGAGASFVQLLDYPYGCSEQVASRLLALLPLAELARAAGVELPKEREHMIEVAIAELLRRQRQDGGFVMWPESDHSEPWVSAHVLNALNYAKSTRAFLGPALERGVEYLRNVAAPPNAAEANPQSLAARTYVADVLVRLGKGDPSALSNLFAVRQQLPPFALALLLHSYAALAHDQKTTALLLSEVERTLHHDGATATVATNVGNDYERLFDSEARTTAITLQAIATAKPEHPLVVPLARGLLAARRNGQWATTQDSAFALLALDTVRRLKPDTSGPAEVEVQLGTRSLFSGELGGSKPNRVSQRVSMAELGKGNGSLSFEAEQGTLLYDARLHYVPLKPPETAIDAGFGVERQFTPVALDGTEMGAGAMTSGAAPCQLRTSRGQILIGEVSVVVPRPREYVVVDAPLPAGFEPVDIGQRSGAAWLKRLDRVEAFGPEQGRMLDVHRDLRDDRVVFMVDHLPIGLYRFRYLARAVTKGQFALPPARVEAMYAPEHLGTTTFCTVEVQ